MDARCQLALDAGKCDATEKKEVPTSKAWQPFTDWAVANNFTQHYLSFEDNSMLWKYYQMGWAMRRRGR